MSRYDAVIFDMDGLLVHTEPLWRASEHAVAAPLGLHLEPADFDASMGLRIDEVVQRWSDRLGGIDVPQVAAEVTQGVIDRLDQAALLPGVHRALERVGDLPVGICSSSASVLIDAVVAHFELGPHFDILHSAEAEPAGKPHPAAYLTTARRLGVAPERCLAFEDSFQTSWDPRVSPSGCSRRSPTARRSAS